MKQIVTDTTAAAATTTTVTTTTVTTAESIKFVFVWTSSDENKISE